MAPAQYFVVLHDDEWKIKHLGKHFGPYISQSEAVKAAVKRANKSGLAGEDAQVLVQGENHQFRAEWTYGNDPYPPHG